MKPFNLNAALQGAKVETNDMQLVDDLKLIHGQVRGFINGLPHRWDKAGKKNKVQSPFDLKMR